MPVNPLGNRDFIRAMNRSTVLNMIKTYSPISRAEIARRTGLSPATVTGITAELLKENLIIEKAAGDSSGGRPPILLALNPTGGFVVGIKLTEDQAIAALTDLEANAIDKLTAPLTGSSPEAVIKDLSLAVGELLAKAGLLKKQLLGVGVGLAGIVDAHEGVLRYSPISGWRNVPLAKLLQDELEVPVTIDNDVNTLTRAEMLYGAGQKINNFLTITIGRGVGMGFVANGQFYRGVRGGAGEFGHTVIDPQGALCDCGKRGCLEAYVSDPGLLRAAAQAHAAGGLPYRPESVASMLELARAGEQAGIDIFRKAGLVLGQSIANLINVLNPEIIIISGEGVRGGDLLFGPMRTAIDQYTMTVLKEDTVIQIDPWGDDDWARGAASLALYELFESPVHREVSGEPALVVP